MSDWTEKYRPKRLDDVIGNNKAKEELKNWAMNWLEGFPKKKALVLIGDPGVGKTTCAHALANDMGWQVVEMNASDRRNAEAIRKVATHGSLGETFTDAGEFISSRSGKRKLIILDEADNVFGREDFGGIKAISSTIMNTQQPVILIVNDYYSLKRRSSVLSGLVKTIQFSKPGKPSIKRLLGSIARSEGVTVSDKVLDSLSEKSSGDVRAAINDLQSIAEGRSKIGDDAVLALGNRDSSRTIFQALAKIYHTGNCRRSRDAMMDLDEDPEMLILWIDENIPNAYKEPVDIAAAYEALAKADRFLGRVKRKQYYGLWSYAGDMMSCGVSMAKSRSYPGYVRYSFPSWLTKMSKSKGFRGTRKTFARKLGRHLNTSNKVVLQEQLPYFRMMYTRDREFRLSMTRRLALSEEEVGFLLGEKADSHPVRHVFDALRKVDAISKGGPPDVRDEEPTNEEGSGITDDEPDAPSEDDDTPPPEKETQSNIFQFG